MIILQHCFTDAVGEGMKRTFGNLKLKGARETHGMSSFQALALAALTRIVTACVKRNTKTPA